MNNIPIVLELTNVHACAMVVCGPDHVVNQLNAIRCSEDCIGPFVRRADNCGPSLGSALYMSIHQERALISHQDLI